MPSFRAQFGLHGAFARCQSLLKMGFNLFIRPPTHCAFYEIFREKMRSYF